MKTRKKNFCRIKKEEDSPLLKFRFVYLIFFVNMLKNFPQAETIFVDWLIANLFATALPNIVSPAITLLTAAAINICSISVMFSVTILRTMLAPIAPLMIPHTSPITSLHMLDTFSAFLIRYMLSFAPLTFRDAMLLNGYMSAAATATPIMSVITAMRSNGMSKTTETIIPVRDKTNSENTVTEKDKITVIIKILIGQRQTLFFFLSDLTFSCFFFFSSSA